MNKTLSELLGRGLAAGRHSADSAECCAVEAISLAKGLPKSDDTGIVGGFDFRRLNDSSFWRDPADLAEGMRGICVAYYDADTWTTERRAAVAGRIALETVRQIISELPGLSDEVRHQCSDAADLKEAVAAARTARAEGVDWAAWAADAAWAAVGWAVEASAGEQELRAADAAAAAGWAAADAAAADAASAGWAVGAASAAAAGRDVLIKACAIWVDAAGSEQ